MDYPDSLGRKAVITGMGIVTTTAENLPDFFQALVNGRSGITRWRNKDERSYSKIGGDMTDFNFDTHVARHGADYPDDLVATARKLLRTAPLPTQLMTTASLQAYVDAGLHADTVDPERLGHVMGGHNLHAQYIFDNAQTFDDEPEYIEPLYGMMSLDTDTLSVTSELVQAKGVTMTVGAACASSNVAFQSALDLIRYNRADVVFVSGVGIDFDSVALHGLGILEAIACRSYNDEPERASRPFDVAREGFVPGQGGGVLVVEAAEHARRRGAHVHAKLMGASVISDACRLTKPNQDGQVRTIRAALLDAGVNPERIDYVNAHATSTPLGDLIEVGALKKVFGTHAYKLAVNATKSMLGHCSTAAGVVEVIATILQMRENTLHPTINLEEQDPELDLDFVPNQAREQKIDYAISNSFGFGGLNSCVVIGKMN